MAEQDRALLDEVVEGAAAMATLARDEGVFRAAVDAFRAWDGESMAKLLERHQLAQHCEIICHWLRSKEAVILCLELAGPAPLQDEQPPEPREFAELVAKLDGRRRDGAADGRRGPGPRRLGLEDADREATASSGSAICCATGSAPSTTGWCARSCARRSRVQRPHLGPELRAAGAALGALVRDERTFDDAAKAVLAGQLRDGCRSTLEGAGFAPFCFFLCEWFCSLALHARLPAAVPDLPAGEARVAAGGDARVRARGRRAGEGVARAADRGDAARGRRAGASRWSRSCASSASASSSATGSASCAATCSACASARRARSASSPRSAGSSTPPTSTATTPATASRSPTSARSISTLRLNGGLSVVDGAPLIEYRFETHRDQLHRRARRAAGRRSPPARSRRPTSARSSARSPCPPFIEVIPVWVNNPAAGVFNITPDADGWIKVPPLFPVAPMVPGSGWRFVPGSDLIHLVTTTLLPFTASVDETGVDAGEAANVPASDVHYGIRMRIRNQGSVGRRHRRRDLLAHRDQQHPLRQHLAPPVLAGRPVRGERRARGGVARDRRAGGARPARRCRTA